MTVVRIVSPGFETYSGSLGFGAIFEDGVSVEPLNRRQIARIGCSLTIVDNETGMQLGPAADLERLTKKMAAVAEPTVTLADEQKVAAEQEKEEAERIALAEANKTQKEKDAAALEEAKRKEEAASGDFVIYSRQELEAIGSNDGIGGLREISDTLGVKARSISDLIDAILTAQAKKAVV